MDQGTPSSPHDTLARRWFGRAYTALEAAEKAAVERAGERRPLSADTNDAFRRGMTLGERLADRVALFGGSWTFIAMFGLTLALWAWLNVQGLRTPFDPYPFIFLNLLLSMLAAIQAPVIMMSQNRLAAKDRMDAAHDYAVNLKAEIEIMALHDKLDAMRTEQLAFLIRTQSEQLVHIRALTPALGRSADAAGIDPSPETTGPTPSE
jgi:uncharacterized membrane protein